MVKAPRGECEAHRSRAARDEWDGTLPLQGDTKRRAMPASRVEPWSVLRLTPENRGEAFFRFSPKTSFRKRRWHLRSK